ncbi:MAG: ribosome small subunit-dependent GTPase A [Clostridia bacterium]|nr:ribosome small subunit-dependent GTPase A [Clostridia bacterium]
MEHIAIVITQSHNLYTVCLDSDHERALMARVSGKLMHRWHSPAEYPAVGDRVALDWDGRSDSAVIRELLPRHGCLNRVGDLHTGQSQIIAANLDALLICTSLNQNYSLRRVERYLAAARAAAVVPVVVLTKADLCADAEQRRREAEAAFPGVEVLLSAVGSAGGGRPGAVARIRELLSQGWFVAFAGSSGVGKSTLVNAVLGREWMHTSAVREADGKGRHTTTHRELLFADCGGAVIDTPGMRAFALDDADVEDVFARVTALARGCRFSDCSHTGEPGCAVRRAVDAGELDAAQWQSYVKLKREEVRRTQRKRGGRR